MQLKIKLQQTDLNDFCKAIIKVAKKAKFVNFVNKNGILLFSAQAETGTVFYEFKTDSSINITGGFSFDKFAACIKHLAADDINFSFGDHLLKIQQANVSVNIPLIDDTVIRKPSFEFRVPEQATPFLVEGLKNVYTCFGNTEKEVKYSGTLLDFSTSLKIVKISPYMIRIASHAQDVGLKRRVVVPFFVGDFCKVFLKKITTARIGVNKIGFELENNISVSIPEYQDDYPDDYQAFLDHNLIDSLVFDKDDILQTVELVSAVSGEESTDLSINVEGLDPETKNAVVKVTGRNFDGTSASEILVTKQPITNEIDEFCTKSKHLLSAFKAYEDTIIMQLSPRSCVIKDTIGETLTILATRTI